MKILSCLLFVLVACGGGNKSTPTNTSSSSSTSTGDGQPCSQEIILSCPDGQIDQCVKERAASDEKIKKMEGGGSDDEGGVGTAMALEEGRVSSLTHKCVAK
jgi:hypothetical protein